MRNLYHIPINNPNRILNNHTVGLLKTKIKHLRSYLIQSNSPKLVSKFKIFFVVSGIPNLLPGCKRPANRIIKTGTQQTVSRLMYTFCFAGLVSFPHFYPFGKLYFAGKQALYWYELMRTKQLVFVSSV